LRLAAVFSGQNIRVERYLIDSAHSNYRSDPNLAELEKVEDYILPSSTSFRNYAYLERNAVTLLVLTPTTSAPTADPLPEIVELLPKSPSRTRKSV
jgi:hypothetical protein